MNGKTSGELGIGSLIAGVILLLVAKRFFPGLAKLMLWLLGAGILLIILLIIVIMYFAFKKPEKTEEQKQTDEIQEILKNGKKNLLGMRKCSIGIKNETIRTLSTEISTLIEKIFHVLKGKPDQVGLLRQFFTYYLPTIEKILVKYKEIESSGVVTEEVTESTISCLEDIKAAMDMQYNKLLRSDILDLTVEMEVLTQICKRDGLLADADFPSEN